MTRYGDVIPDCLYWTKIRTAVGYLFELSGMGDAGAMLDLLREGERAEMRDARRGVIRAVSTEAGRINAALFITADSSLPPRDWLISQLDAGQASTNELLAGRPATPLPDRGAIVCVCFDIGIKTIITAIAEQSLTSVESVGAAINAGTNCGSCRPAIAKLLEAVD